jgi:hypothetical protein
MVEDDVRKKRSDANRIPPAAPAHFAGYIK